MLARATNVRLLSPQKRINEPDQLRLRNDTELISYLLELTVEADAAAQGWQVRIDKLEVDECPGQLHVDTVYLGEVVSSYEMLIDDRLRKSSLEQLQEKARGSSL